MTDFRSGPDEPNLPDDAFEPLVPASARAAAATGPDTADPAPTARGVATESPDAVAFAGRTGTPSKLRAGVVAGAAVALAVGAVATSFAASPSPSSSGAPGVTTPGTPATDPSVLLPGDHRGPGDLDGRGGFGRGIGRDITISAINGSDLSLQTEDGWSRTITVTSTTELTKGGQPITLADLEVGDEVRFAQTRNDDGTYTVTAVAVVVPSVAGTVSDVTASGFKVTGRDGAVWTITVDGSTEYRFGSADGSLDDVTAGSTVRVQGESTGDNALRALTVQVAGDHAVGTVTAKTGDTITLKTRDGSTVTVHLDGDTTYRVAGVESADLGDVAVDMTVGVEGRSRDDGSIDAAVVATGLRGFGHGPGSDGRGHGGFGDQKDDSAPSAAPSATP